MVDSLSPSPLTSTNTGGNNITSSTNASLTCNSGNSENTSTKIETIALNNETTATNSANETQIMQNSDFQQSHYANGQLNDSTGDILAPKKIKMEPYETKSFENTANIDSETQQQTMTNGENTEIMQSENCQFSVDVKETDSANCGVCFEGVISFNSEDSTCTLSVRIDSEGIFKVVTANVFTFQDFLHASGNDQLKTFSEELQSISKRDLTSELNFLKQNTDSQKLKSSNLNFMLCFACNTSYSDVIGLSEHGKLCHNCSFSKDEFSFFDESQCSVVFQPLCSTLENSIIAVLCLDNIREVSLESLKIASRHLIQGNSSGTKSEDDENSSDILTSLFSSESGTTSNYTNASVDFNSTSNNILSHMAMCHSRNSSKTLKCPKCNWHYKYQQTLDAHMKEKHSESINNCDYCTNNEPHPKLSRGETYSCGYKPFKCEVCNYSTTTKGNLSIHMQSDKHLNNVQELKRNNGSLEETTNANSATISAVTAQSSANQNAQNLVDTLGGNLQSAAANFFKCPACDFQTTNAASFKLHVAADHALLSLQTGANSSAATDLASALITQQQQTTNDILQSLILQRQLEAVAAVTTNPEASSLFVGGLEGILPQINSAAAASASLNAAATTNESGVFSCGICNRFCSDDAHLIQNHALRDRTSMTSQDYSTVNNSTFKCLLCNYSTNLKANFTLHSQTEKHKQKVQIFNHLKEGNENLESIFAIIHQISPIQITCNACDFQAKSIGQLNAHLTSDSHVLALKLFEIFTSLTSKPGAKFNCKVCSSGFMTKSEIISHVQQAQHCSKLRSKKLQSGNNSTENSWQDFFEVSSENSMITTDRTSISSSVANKASEIYGEAFNCPLCAKPSKTRDLLRDHILQDHRVSSDCIEALLAAVKPTMSVKPVARAPRVVKSPVVTSDIVSDSSNVGSSSVMSSALSVASAQSLFSANSNVGGLKYRCHRCRSEFNHTLDLYNHVKSCTNYLCSTVPDCKQSFPTHNSLSNHISAHPDQDSSLPCWDPKCGQNFLSEENLIQHFFDSTTHLPPGLTCSTCLTTFLSESTFSAHILNSNCASSEQNSRGSQNEFKNDLLDSFPIISQYSTSSLSSRPFQCNNCNFAFICQSNLQMHNNTAHKQPNLTGKTGVQNSENQLANSAESSVKTEKPFRCDACDVAYSSESTLKIHLASLLHKETINRQSKLSANQNTSSSPESNSNEQQSVNPIQSTSEETPGCKLGSGDGLASVFSADNVAGISAGQNLAENLDEAIRNLAQQQQSSNAMNSSLAAMNLLSNMGLQVSAQDLKMFQDTMAASQQLQSSSLLDVQTQMALLQQQQFLLQHQKLISSLMPFYNNMPQQQIASQAQLTQDLLSNSQSLSTNSKLSELFKISISGINGSDEQQSLVEAANALDQINSTSTESDEANTESSIATVDGKQQNPVDSSVSTKTRRSEGSYSSSPNETVNVLSSKTESSTPIKQSMADVTSLQIAEEQSANINENGLVGNFQDDDDDNMFYSDDFPQSESDSGNNSDSESQSGSSFAQNNDQLNQQTNAFILQQAALYQQLFMQNPAALSAILPAAALANSNFGSQLFANNPFLSMIASAANGSKSPTTNTTSSTSSSTEASQKQPRTKISEQQLEILKQNFDISNLPSEERYVAISQQTGLPVKVIKHWFRNTLFKERQKDKDSPYNFNNPPSSSNSANSNSSSTSSATQQSNNAALSLQQAIFNNMQSLLPGANAGTTGQFDPSKFNMGALCSSSSGKPPSPMSIFLQQQNQQHISTKRATRTRFTDHQIKSLQDFFDQNPYPRDDDLENLSRSLNLSPRVVVVWFQNQRQKARRSMEITTGAETTTGSQSGQSYPNSVSSVGSSAQDTTSSLGSSSRVDLNPRSTLDLDATKLVQEVVNMVAGNHANQNSYNESVINEHEPEPTTAENFTTVVEPQPAPNFDVLNAVTSSASTNHETGSGKLRNREDSGDSSKLTIKEDIETNDGGGHSSQDDDEFYYNCSLCPAILASEEELDSHQRAHIEQVALTISGLSAQQEQQNSQSESCSDLAAMQRMSDKYAALDNVANSNESPNVNIFSDAQSQFDANSAGSQEYFRRMRTTISPDQLEVLYTKYGENSNPSRTEMETIANSVGLSRRVVQVWYQNTRARQRRGQCRVIGNTVYHCKCPYCDTICKSKSHLSQHVQKEHSDRAKNAIQIAPSTLDASGNVRSTAPPNVTITTKPSETNGGSGIPNATVGTKTNSSNLSNNDPQPLESLVASVSSIVNAASRNFGASLKALGLGDESSNDAKSVTSLSDFVNQQNSSIVNVKSFEDSEEVKLHEVSFYSDGSK